MYSHDNENEQVSSSENADRPVRRHNLFDDMTPALKKKVTSIQTWFGNFHRNLTQNHFQLGLEIREIVEDVEFYNGSRYGRRALEQLSAYFGWGKSTLHSARKLAEQYTQEEIDQISQMKTKDGQPIMYTHLRHLFIIDRREERWRLLHEVVEQSLTCDELYDLVKEELKLSMPPGVQKSRRGRPLGQPKDFEGVVNQQIHFANDFYDRSEKVWEHPQKGLVARAEKLPDEEITTARLHDLKHFADVMKKMAGKAQQRADEAHQVYENLKQRYDQQTGKAPKPDPLQNLTAAKLMEGMANFQMEEASV